MEGDDNFAVVAGSECVDNELSSTRETDEVVVEAAAHSSYAALPAPLDSLSHALESVLLERGAPGPVARVLASLVANPLAAGFLEPVTSLHPEIASAYTRTVARPLDLGRVARRANRGSYTNPEGLRRARRNLRRLFLNAEAFNAADPLVASLARHLRKHSDALWQAAAGSRGMRKQQVGNDEPIVGAAALSEARDDRPTDLEDPRAAREVLLTGAGLAADDLDTCVSIVDEVVVHAAALSLYMDSNNGATGNAATEAQADSQAILPQAWRSSKEAEALGELRHSLIAAAEQCRLEDARRMVEAQKQAVADAARTKVPTKKESTKKGGRASSQQQQQQQQQHQHQQETEAQGRMLPPTQQLAESSPPLAASQDEAAITQPGTQGALEGATSGAQAFATDAQIQSADIQTTSAEPIATESTVAESTVSESSAAPVAEALPGAVGSLEVAQASSSEEKTAMAPPPTLPEPEPLPQVAPLPPIPSAIDFPAFRKRVQEATSFLEAAVRDQPSDDHHGLKAAAQEFQAKLAWRLEEMELALAERAERGVGQSSVWASPQGVFWAQISGNSSGGSSGGSGGSSGSNSSNNFWPTLLLDARGIPGANAALGALNVGRVPETIHKQLARQKGGKASQAARSGEGHHPLVLVEYLGSHEFAWVRASSLTPFNGPASNPAIQRQSPPPSSAAAGEGGASAGPEPAPKQPKQSRQPKKFLDALVEAAELAKEGLGICRGPGHFYTFDESSSSSSSSTGSGASDAPPLQWFDAPRASGRGQWRLGEGEQPEEEDDEGSASSSSDEDEDLEKQRANILRRQSSASQPWGSARWGGSGGGRGGDERSGAMIHRRAAQFPVELLAMLDASEADPAQRFSSSLPDPALLRRACGWSPDGTAVVVRDVGLLESEAMPAFFKRIRKIRSFKFQLSAFGFKREPYVHALHGLPESSDNAGEAAGDAAAAPGPAAMDVVGEATATTATMEASLTDSAGSGPLQPTSTPEGGSTAEVAVASADAAAAGAVSMVVDAAATDSAPAAAAPEIVAAADGAEAAASETASSAGSAAAAKGGAAKPKERYVFTHPVFTRAMGYSSLAALAEAAEEDARVALAHEAATSSSSSSSSKGSGGNRSRSGGGGDKSGSANKGQVAVGGRGNLFGPPADDPAFGHPAAIAQRVACAAERIGDYLQALWRKESSQVRAGAVWHTDKRQLDNANKSQRGGGKAWKSGKKTSGGSSSTSKGGGKGGKGGKSGGKGRSKSSKAGGSGNSSGTGGLSNAELEALFPPPDWDGCDPETPGWTEEWPKPLTPWEMETDALNVAALKTLVASATTTGATPPLLPISSAAEASVLGSNTGGGESAPPPAAAAASSTSYSSGGSGGSSASASHTRKALLRAWADRLHDECATFAAALAEATPYSSLARPSGPAGQKRRRAPPGERGERSAAAAAAAAAGEGEGDGSGATSAAASGEGATGEDVASPAKRSRGAPKGGSSKGKAGAIGDAEPEAAEEEAATAHGDLGAPGGAAGEEEDIDGEGDAEMGEGEAGRAMQTPVPGGDDGDTDSANKKKRCVLVLFVLSLH